uniref:Uncharacterized protein n=1 Tax=Anopheles darlingi TaxID=43151 RepID=A0A2M4DBY0_ANODA
MSVFRSLTACVVFFFVCLFTSSFIIPNQNGTLHKLATSHDLNNGACPYTNIIPFAFLCALFHTFSTLSCSDAFSADDKDDIVSFPFVANLPYLRTSICSTVAAFLILVLF